MERNQLEHVAVLQTEQMGKLEAANKRLTGSKKAIAAGEAAGGAIGTLVAIMQDTTLTTRRRIQAAEQLLMYKSPEHVAALAKLYLSAVFTDPDESVDLRLMATTALRKSEDPRIMPAIERPPVRPDPELDPEKERRDLAERMRLRREHIDRMSAQMEADLSLKGPWSTD
jgi:hypothetical protein